MDAEDSVFDESCKSEVVKDFSAILPDIETAVLLQTFIIETIDLGNLSTFVVASDQKYPLWVFHLQS